MLKSTGRWASSAVIVLAVSAVGWRWIRVFDVLALGRDASIGLGVEHRRLVTGIQVMADGRGFGCE